nr:xylulose kinase-1 [Tanacetum cinerariifolium]
MALTFTDTHNMIAFLTKSDASEGFDQIIDFLNASSIKYALTVNPNIYVSVIKQFWSTIAVKKVNDVTRLQALVDKKKFIITEATIREALRLDNAKGINCLPNEEIFTELAMIGYEKPSTKLTFYKDFLSSQWKAQVGDLSLHSIKYSSPVLTQKVFANMRRVGKGFSGVDTPLFEGMLVAQQADEGAAEVNVDDVPAAGVADEGAASVNVNDIPTAVDEPSIPSPTPLLERNKVKLECDQVIVARNKRNAELEQETELLKTTLRNKEATISSLTNETKTVLSEKKTLEDKYLEEIFCLKNANQVATGLLQKFQMPTQTIPMLSKRPMIASNDIHKTCLGLSNLWFGRKAQLSQPTLYDGHRLLQPDHVPVMVSDSHETLLETKFVPQKELSREQVYWLSTFDIASQS